MNWQRIKKWIIENYEEKSEAEETELIWLRKTVKPNEKINWNFVDTVDYNIESIPRKRELILEFRAKPKEVGRKCQNLLNLKKVHL